MVADPKPSGRSTGRAIFAVVIGVIFLIGLVRVMRWVGSLLGLLYFVLLIAAVVAIVVVARRR